MHGTSWHEVLLSTAVVTALLGALPVRAQHSDDHRSKRWIFMTAENPSSVSFLLEYPLSFGIPTLVNAVRARSMGDDGPQEHLPDEEYPDDLYWEPAYEQELDLLQVYFSYLKIPTLACQERLACELAASPEQYSPLSQHILRKLRQVRGPVTPSQDSIMWRLMAASATGYVYGEEECGEYYGKCKLSAKQQLNMPVLKVWQYISTKFNLMLL